MNSKFRLKYKIVKFINKDLKSMKAIAREREPLEAIACHIRKLVNMDPATCSVHANNFSNNF